MLDPKTGYPKFVLKHERGHVKLYDSEDTISKFYDYKTKPELGPSIPEEFQGDFKPGKVDEIRLQDNQVEINFEKLPKDVAYNKH